MLISNAVVGVLAAVTTPVTCGYLAILVPWMYDDQFMEPVWAGWMVLPITLIVSCFVVMTYICYYYACTGTQNSNSLRVRKFESTSQSICTQIENSLLVNVFL